MVDDVIALVKRTRYVQHAHLVTLRHRCRFVVVSMRARLVCSELVKPVWTASKQKFQTLVPFPKIGSAVPTQRALVSVFYKNSPVRSSADHFRAKHLRVVCEISNQSVCTTRRCRIAVRTG